LYPATPTLSVDAVQFNSAVVDVGVPAARFAGVDGGVVSPPPPVPLPPSGSWIEASSACFCAFAGVRSYWLSSSPNESSPLSAQ
jgi:hypothetical protein